MTFPRKIASVSLTAIVTVFLSCAGAYIAAIKAQVNHEIRLQTAEKNLAAHEALQIEEERETASRIRADLAEIKSDLKEIRAAQIRYFEHMAEQRR